MHTSPHVFSIQCKIYLYWKLFICTYCRDTYVGYLYFDTGDVQGGYQSESANLAHTLRSTPRVRPLGLQEP